VLYSIRVGGDRVGRGIFLIGLKYIFFSCDFFFYFAMMMYVLSRCLAYEGDVHIRAMAVFFSIIFFNIVGYHYCPRDVLLVRPRW
jgi:hypothetical protein